MAYKFNETHRRLVEQWSAVGLSQENMCSLLSKYMKLPRQIKVETLQKQFAQELATGGAAANAAIAGALFDKAKGGSVDAMKFWLDRRGGEKWKQQQNVDLTTNGKSIASGGTATPAEFKEIVKQVLDEY